MQNHRRLPQNLLLNVKENDATSEASMPVIMQTEKGDISTHYFPAHNTSFGALWVGGINNSQGSPVETLFADAAEHLTSEGIVSLKVLFRNSGDFEDCEYDIEAGLAFLENKGIDSVALIGHSFGGAIVIRVATQISSVRTVVTLASQSLGADGVANLNSSCSILFLHGTDDEILSSGCSQYLHELAQTQKKLLLCPGADHNFEPLTEIVQQRVCEWIIKELKE